MNNEFMQYCDRKIAACSARRAALSADDRGDEARFEQIRSNVYGIFRAVCTALQGDPARIAAKMGEITSAWQESLDRAQAHEDTEKACIEQIKLDAAEEMRRALLTHGRQEGV